MAGIGRAHTQLSDTEARQQLAIVATQLYTKLSALKSGYEKVAMQLSDSPCVWVGHGFEPPSHVALEGPLDLAPYLYVIPRELTPFQSFLLAIGVQARFTAAQYAALLRELKAEAGQQPLPESQLQQALAVCIALADDVIPADVTLFVPDTAGVLQHAGDLVYNDAAWAEQRPDVLFVHPTISNNVAASLGAASLRRAMLAQGMDSMPLGVDTVEAFGQSEALTTRLRHIIESYVDGPGILFELMQNADDAGASEVGFVLDCTNYPTSSLLSPAMADLQGPALLSYNDS